MHNSNKNISFDDFAKICKDLGIKATLQRFEIYSELLSSTEHPDVELIFTKIKKNIPSISFDTVYRTVKSFEEKGLIYRIPMLDNKMRWDANLSNHHHFVCQECGDIKDFYSDKLNKISLPEEMKNIGKPNKLHIEVIGSCNDCHSNKN